MSKTKAKKIQDKKASKISGKKILKISNFVMISLAIVGGLCIFYDYYIKQSSINDHETILSDEEIIQNLLHNMVFVDGGTFMMGSENHYKNEQPMHQETVKPYSIGKYEVTQKEWKAVMGNNPSEFKGDYLPVENVSWYECQEFIQKLNALTGKDFRLPTEEEWEYAARGGRYDFNPGLKFSGGLEADEIAWLSGNSEKKTHKVGTKRSNELGLYDMTGNVQEWTSSNWSEDYDVKRDSERFVIRGGDFTNWIVTPFVSLRSGYNPNDHKNFIGLRLALSAK